jgi:hypothetical protein
MNAEQKEIIEEYIEYALPILSQDLDEKLAIVPHFEDRKRMIEAEIEKVNRHMTDKEMIAMFVFPFLSGARILSFSPFSLQLGDNKQGNGLAGGTLSGLLNNSLAELYHKLANSDWGAGKLEETDYGKYALLQVLKAYKLFLEIRLKQGYSGMSNTADKIKPNALEYLQILSGKNVHGQQIMFDADFKRLKSYVETMIEQGRLPEGLEPISQVQFPNSHIRYLFRCIHAEQYAERKIQDHFIDFIHVVFPMFTGKKEITKRKFGEEPTTWKPDLEKMRGG